jgi:hypothetical protein
MNDGDYKIWRMFPRDIDESAAPTLLADPLPALYGSEKTTWNDEHADEYVASLRNGW